MTDIDTVIDLEPSGITITNHIAPRLSYTADEMAAVVAERDRLRKFVSSIRLADSAAIVTDTASLVRAAVKWLDSHNT